VQYRVFNRGIPIRRLDEDTEGQTWRKKGFLQAVRRADIFWSGNEIETYERLKRLAREERVQIADFVKRIVARFLRDANV